MRVRRTLLIAVVVASLAAGCATADSEPADTAVAQQLRDRMEGVDGGWGPARTYMELLPTTRFFDLRTGSDAFNPMERYIVGEVIDARAGRFFASQEDDPFVPEAWEVEAESKQFSFATIHIDVRPTSLIGPEGLERNPPDVVTLGLVVGDPNVEKFVGELARFGTISTPLFTGASVFAYDPSIHSIPLEGTLLAVVDEDGTLTFPFADEHALDQLEVANGQVPTDSVVDEGRSPKRIDVVMVGPVALSPDDTDGLLKRGIDPATLEPEAG